VPPVASHAGQARQAAARTGFEGVPTSILSRQFEEARTTLRASQSRADLIRRELTRRKKKNRT